MSLEISPIPLLFDSKKEFLQYMIMRALKSSSMHGYELIKYMKDATEGRWVPSHSMLYPLLKSLEDDGLIKSSVSKRGELVKKVYVLTEKGEKMLESYITKTATFFSCFIERYITNNKKIEDIPAFPLLILTSSIGKEVLKRYPKKRQLTLLRFLKKKLEKITKNLDNEIEKLERNMKNNASEV